MKFKFKKYWFDYLIYISIIFLLLALSKADYLAIPEIYSLKYLLLSFLALFSGFLLNSIAWKQILEFSNFPISFKHSISSAGLAVFGKYIPGKLWAMIGQAGYIVKKYNYPKRDMAAIILNAQFIFIWLGLILSALGLFLLGNYCFAGIIILIICIILSFIIFTSIPHKVAERIIWKVFKRDIHILKLSNRALQRASFSYLLNWTFWCIGFYFLIKSLSGTEINIGIGLDFAIACSIGFFVLIFPGGIGVRESILVVCLTSTGFDVQQATAISIASRLWFLIGEFFFFGLGFIIDKFNLNKEDFRSF